MGGRKLKGSALLSYGVMGIAGLWVGLSEGAIAALTLSQLSRDSPPEASQNLQIAQADSGCRQTNATTGVYEQPNLDSASRGILPTAQTVRLELLGTGTGWARINQPLVGWIEARYLTPNAACTGLEPSAAAPANPAAARSAQATDRAAEQVSSPTPMPRQTEQRSRPSEASSFPSPDLPNQRSNRPASGSPAPTVQAPPSRSSGTPTSAAQITTVSCDVLPAYGLIVRREPTVVGDTYLTTIPTGTYQFQFTRNTQTNETPEGTRRWVYITAPVEGWISLGYVGKDFNLGGRECG